MRAMRTRHGTALALGLGAALLAAAPARAQMDSREGIQLQNQILELRRDLDSMRAQLQAGGGGGGGAYVPPPVSGGGGGGDLNAQLLERVTRLEDAVRALRGRVDEVDNARQRQADDFNKQLGDLNFKLGAGGASGGASGGAAGVAASPGSGTIAPPPAAAPGLPTPPLPRRTPEVALAEGNLALNRRDYPAAEAAAREVLATGRGPRTTDAQYLLAQSQAGRRDYTSAAVSFDDAYTRSPRGGRAPDSLLGLANALTALNEKKAACQTLDKLRAEFPSPRPDLRAPVAGARQRAGCA